MRLTEISVRALKGSETYATYFDDTLPGFGVGVGKRSRTFIVLRGKQRQRVSIGKWPDLTVGEARAEAKRLLIEEVQPQPAGILFEKARDAFLDHYDCQTAPKRGPSSIHGSAARCVALSQRSASPLGEPPPSQQHPEGGLGGG